MSRDAVFKQLLNEYEQQRADNEAALKRRMQEAVAMDPEIGRLLQRREHLFANSLSSALGRPKEAMAISATLAAQLEDIHAALAGRLQALGLAEDTLQLQWNCSLCRDTGYVGEPVRRVCSCMEQKLLNRLYAEQGLADLARENFEAFDETVFPDVPGADGLSQRAYMQKIRGLCEAYADHFPDTPTPNLLFFGPSGLGKSFLLNAIAQRVLSRGFSVLRITAYDMLMRMRAVHFGADAAEQTGPLFSVSLLLVDDLGTEPMLENITINQLFNLLNERQSRQKGTVISTNFSLEELNGAYTERVTSRLLDQRTTQILRFWGQDVRRFRRQA